MSWALIFRRLGVNEDAAEGLMSALKRDKQCCCCSWADQSTSSYEGIFELIHSKTENDYLFFYRCSSIAFKSCIMIPAVLSLLEIFSSRFDHLRAEKAVVIALSRNDLNYFIVSSLAEWTLDDVTVFTYTNTLHIQSKTMPCMAWYWYLNRVDSGIISRLARACLAMMPSDSLCGQCRERSVTLY